jgi:ribosomal protein L37AE/L43A
MCTEIQTLDQQLVKYQCPVCSHILKDAVQTSCGHWMCNGCAEDFFKDNYQPVCPRDDCKEELTDEDGRPFFPDRFVRKEISRFTIKCLNTEFGCKWIGSIGEFTDHLKICSYNGKKCPHCNLFMTLADVRTLSVTL